MQNSMENNKNKNKDKNNLRIFTQNALKSGISEEEVAKVTAIATKTIGPKQNGELQKEEDFIMY